MGGRECTCVGGDGEGEGEEEQASMKFVTGLLCNTGRW